MGISAFLTAPMAKEPEKLELRLVEEDTKPDKSYIRLGEDAVEVMEDLPPVRLETVVSSGMNAAGRDELKKRSNEPDLRSLIEMDIPAPSEPWETKQAEGPGFPWGWVALIACIFGAAIIWSLVNVNSAEQQRKDFNQDALAILEKDNQEEIEAIEMIDTLDGVVRDFFDARSVDEMLRFVRHPERVRPLMENYYGKEAPEPRRVMQVNSLKPITIDKRRGDFWMVSCDLNNQLRVDLLLEALSAKEAKVDWETFACYQPMAWNEFARTRPGGYSGDFRVSVQRDNFHSHEFADSETYDCYRLTAMDSEETLYGYVRRKTALASRMAELTEGMDGSPVPMILRLHLQEGLDSPRGLHVLELVNPRWVFVEDPGIKEP